MFVNTDHLISHRDELPAATDFEKAYRDYVYAKYTLLPDSDTMNELAQEYGYIPDYDGTNIAGISSAIRKILTDSAEYTLEPGITPSDKELTWYLLKENHKGYCSHFATAAVVLARMNGVPARYTEGYIVIPSDIEKADMVENYYKVDIHDSRAHAWAEFYIDGYGWLPFEFTPGYDHGIISAEEKMNEEAASTEEAAVTVTETVTEPVQTEAVTEAAPVTEIVTEIVGVPESRETEEAETQNDNENEKEKGFFETAVSAVTGFITAAAVLFVIIASVIILKHISVINKRNRSFRNASNNRSMAAVYSYTLELLAHYGIGKGSMMPLEFADYAEEQAEGLVEKGALKDMIDLALKSGFSKDEITDEELARSVKTAKTLAESICSTKSRKEGFVFRYILNLK
ncbi:transglutaminase-like domain-containing protein [Ruminococcus sp. HUN007]|uniref:transglutaminase-like domain-containing protein n=1 Tax=Ruminococcus sp. HUN007 TaxID=1514668 RepID=UPI0005D1BFDC|nr:transglutaminase-like domain-containing protein [Ruminococcus sp. HUN007]